MYALNLLLRLALAKIKQLCHSKLLSYTIALIMLLLIVCSFRDRKYIRSYKLSIYQSTISQVEHYHLVTSDSFYFTHSWHGDTYTPFKSLSVNVITLKCGLLSAIFFNHSLHAPQGLSGFMSYKYHKLKKMLV